jgi:hypothetical protein
MLKGKTERETCDLNRWVVGDVLMGTEFRSTDRIVITGIGVDKILAVSFRTKEESHWTLTCRLWHRIGHIEAEILRGPVDRWEWPDERPLDPVILPCPQLEFEAISNGRCTAVVCPETLPAGVDMLVAGDIAMIRRTGAIIPWDGMPSGDDIPVVITYVTEHEFTWQAFSSHAVVLSFKRTDLKNAVLKTG